MLSRFRRKQTSVVAAASAAHSTIREPSVAAASAAHSVPRKPLFVFKATGKPGSFTRNVELYEDDSAERIGSYQNIKSVVEKGGLSKAFVFDDATKTIKCYGPLQYIKFNISLVFALNECFPQFSLRSVFKPDAMAYLSGYCERADLWIEEARKTSELEKEADSYFKGKGSVKSKETHGSSVFGSKNLCIGESHSSSAARRFMIENMRSFASKGYKTMFLEHLFYDSVMQEELNDYHTKGEPMSAGLTRYLGALGRGYCCFGDKYDEQYNFVTLVREARKYGVRIVGIDTVQSYEMGNTEFGSQGAERMKGMNYEAQRIINRESGGEKWISLMGNAHISQCYGVLGVSQIIPNSVAVDVEYDECKQSGIAYNRQKRIIGGEEVCSDVRIYCKRKTSLELSALVSDGVMAVAAVSEERKEKIDKVLQQIREVKDIFLLHSLFRVTPVREDGTRVLTVEQTEFDEWYNQHRVNLPGRVGMTGTVTGTTGDLFNLLRSANNDPSLENVLPGINSLVKYDDESLLRRVLEVNEDPQLLAAFGFVEKLENINQEWQAHKQQKKEMLLDIYNDLKSGVAYEGCEVTRMYDDTFFLLRVDGNPNQLVITANFEECIKDINLEDLRKISERNKTVTSVVETPVLVTAESQGDEIDDLDDHLEYPVEDDEPFKTLKQEGSFACEDGTMIVISKTGDVVVEYETTTAIFRSPAASGSGSGDSAASDDRVFVECALFNDTSCVRVGDVTAKSLLAHINGITKGKKLSKIESRVTSGVVEGGATATQLDSRVMAV